MPKVPIPLPPDLEAAASAVLEENAKTPSASSHEAAVEPLRVGPLTFREVTFGDVEALRLLGSPFYARFAGTGSGGEVEPGALIDAVYLLTTPAPRALALAQQGAAEFRKASSSAVDLVDAPITVSRSLHAAVESIIRSALHG